jgi:hypothetical protein
VARRPASPRTTSAEPSTSSRRGRTSCLRRRRTCVTTASCTWLQASPITIAAVASFHGCTLSSIPPSVLSVLPPCLPPCLPPFLALPCF